MYLLILTPYPISWVKAISAKGVHPKSQIKIMPKSLNANFLSTKKMSSCKWFLGIVLWINDGSFDAEEKWSSWRFWIVARVRRVYTNIWNWQEAFKIVFPFRVYFSKPVFRVWIKAKTGYPVYFGFGKSLKKV